MHLIEYCLCPAFPHAFPSEWCSTHMPIFPPATIGVIGGGQLGRMLAFEAKQLGYRVVCIDPTPHSPAGQVSDEQIVAGLDHAAAVAELCRRSHVLTYEFENVGSTALDVIASTDTPIFPSVQAMRTSRDRLSQKDFLTSKGIKVASYRRVENEEDLKAAMQSIGFPAVLKTATLGYDGKGQAVVHDEDAAKEAYASLSGRPLVYEKFVPFVKELSVMCARNKSGDIALYPVAENIHKDNILDTSIVPARVSPTAVSNVHSVARSIAQSLDVIGIFCVECFLLSDDSVLVNETCMRPHNSGHYSIDACTCSQFEQQVRAVCDLPLGSTALISPAVMVNILGTGSGNHLSGMASALQDPRVHLHLYGKREAAAKRKMGHLTAVAPTIEEALSSALSARAKLSWVTE